jgi:hypothetical protein
MTQSRLTCPVIRVEPITNLKNTLVVRLRLFVIPLCHKQASQMALLRWRRRSVPEPDLPAIRFWLEGHSELVARDGDPIMRR